MSWTIRINGIRYPATLDEIVEELNGDEYAAFTFQNDFRTRGILASNQNVIIKFFNRIVYKGVLTGGDYKQDSLKVKVYNPVYYYMNKKTHTNIWNNVAGNIVLSGIAHDAGVSYGQSPSGHNIKINYDFTNSLDAAMFLAESTDKDIWSSGFDTINIGTRGSDKGKIKNVTISKRGIDRFKTRNRIRIRGQDASGVRIYGLAGMSSNNTTIITGVGRIGDMVGNDEKPYTEKKARSVSELDAIAKYKLELFRKDTDAMQIRIPINDGYKLFPGDSITLNDVELNLNDSYRIWKTTKKENVLIAELDKPANLVQKEIMDMKKLDDLGIYPIAASQIAPDSIDTIHISDGAITTNKVFPYAITSPKITAGQIIGKDIRTAANVGAGVDGVKMTPAGIEGWNGGTLQFSLSSGDGKARAGGGAVVLDQGGIKVYGREAKFYDESSVLMGYIKGSGDIPAPYSQPGFCIVPSGLEMLYLGDEQGTQGHFFVDPATGAIKASGKISAVYHAPTTTINASTRLNLNTPDLRINGATADSTTLVFDGSGSGYIRLVFTEGILTGVSFP